MDAMESEIEITLSESDDQKVIILTCVSDHPIETNEFLLALEAYLTELTKAAYQRLQPDVEFTELFFEPINIAKQVPNV